MFDYELSPSAENDLSEIANYTIQTWGSEQAAKYQHVLEERFIAIACKRAEARTFLLHRPDLFVTHCERHHIFYQEREVEGPLIIAILHEKMDLMKRLQDRLEGSKRLLSAVD